MVTWCYAKNRTSFHRQDVFHEDDDRAPHGPGIHAATPRTPTNRGKKVECPLCRRLKYRKDGRCADYTRNHQPDQGRREHVRIADGPEEIRLTGGLD